MKTVALIPARAGSKRLVGKNMVDLGGKPLIEYTIESVLQSDCFTEVIVSSDDENVLDFIKKFGNKVVAHRRSQKFSSDTATTTQVLLQLLKTMYFGNAPDICGIFLPTAPFRTVEDIKAGMALMGNDIDCVVAVTKQDVPPEFHFEIDGKNICKIPLNSPLLQGRTRQQEYKTRYFPNGALYLTRPVHLLKHSSFFAGRVAALEMPGERSIDIDTQLDLEIAGLLIKSKRF